MKHARNPGTCALGLRILEELLILGIEATLDLFHRCGGIELLLAHQRGNFGAGLFDLGDIAKTFTVVFRLREQAGVELEALTFGLSGLGSLKRLVSVLKPAHA